MESPLSAPTPAGNLLSIVDATWNNLQWREFAGCHDVDTNLFFPTGTDIASLDQTNLAKKICRDCPVMTQCLEFALRTRQDHGIWGAMTEDERRVIRRQRRVAARRAAGNATARAS